MFRKKKDKLDNDRKLEKKIPLKTKKKQVESNKIKEDKNRREVSSNTSNSIAESDINVDKQIDVSTPTIKNSDNKENVEEKDSIKEELDPNIPIDTAEEINNLLLSIVSGFSEYFYHVAEDIFGSRPNKITFDSITSSKMIGNLGIQLVSVNFSSELGRGRAGLAVKIYDNPSDVPPVISTMEFVKQKIAPYKHLGVNTPRIIFTREQILVMEGITGESFRHSSVPLTEKYRLAGKCLATLHGASSNNADINQYRAIEKQVIATLPFSDEGRKNINQIFADFPLEQIAEKAGAISFGDFHAGNLLFEISLYKSPLLTAHLIDPDFLQTTPNHDRFADIANFFVNRAISTYSKKGNLFQISRELRSFVAGYDEVLAYKVRELKNFYKEKENSFNYHLALGILLSILNLISMPDVSPEYISQQMEPRIKIAMLLLESPSLLEGRKELIQA